MTKAYSENFAHNCDERDPIIRLELALKLLSPQYRAHTSKRSDELERQLRLLARSDTERSMNVSELACVVAEREIARLRESRSTK